MTTLTELIDNYRKYKEKFTFNSQRDKAACELADYVLAHADAIAERERLERAVVEACNAKGNLWEFEREANVEAAQAELTRWLLAHADDGAAT